MSEALKRQLDILKMLSKERALKTSEVHQKLEHLGHCVSKRTAERNLQSLSCTYHITTIETSYCYQISNYDGKKLLSR